MPNYPILTFKFTIFLPLRYKNENKKVYLQDQTLAHTPGAGGGLRRRVRTGDRVSESARNTEFYPTDNM